MKTFDFYLGILFNLNFFKSNILNYDSIFNDLVLYSSEYSVILNYYVISFDLYIFLKVWHRLIFLNFKFYIIFSKYIKYFEDVIQSKFDFDIESFMIIDYYYKNTMKSNISDMYIGFFTNNIYYQEYILRSKKLLFVSLCKQYSRNYFYKRVIQYLYKSINNLGDLRIPDFFLIFGMNNKMPTNLFELLKLNICSLGIFDLGVSSDCVRQFMYTFVSGNLSFLMFIFLLKFLFFDYKCAAFERIKIFITKCDNGKIYYGMSDLNFNLFLLTRFSLLYKKSVLYMDFLDNLLLVLLSQFKILYNFETFINYKYFSNYLCVYLYLKILSV